jgi:lipoprotein-anchoring transpeptidase ErfK/SrfK
MKTGWLTDGGKKYYFANNGKMKTGWLKLNNAKYYFSDKGVMFTGKHTIKGSKYYFDDNTGKMKTGWVSDGGSKYYYNDNGKQHFGWLKLNGKKYYLDAKSGKMQTGRKNVSGSYYYFASNGVMAASKAVKISGKLHYFFSSGKEVTGKGWFKGSDKKSRYATGGGTVATGKKTINGITYKFSTKTGVCIANLGDVYDQKIRNVSSNTSYLLYAIKGKFQVRVYKGSKGNWSRVHTFDCAFGKSSNPTANGNYTVNSKTPHHNYGGGKYHWNNGLNYTGSSAKPGAGFNGYVWTGQYPDGNIYDSKLRAYCTGGRIRVAESNSVWLYNNIPVGTKVVVQ